MSRQTKLVIAMLFTTYTQAHTHTHPLKSSVSRLNHMFENVQFQLSSQLSSRLALTMKLEHILSQLISPGHRRVIGQSVAWHRHR